MGYSRYTTREHRITNLSQPLNVNETLSVNNIAQMIDRLSRRKVSIHRCILYLHPEEKGAFECFWGISVGLVASKWGSMIAFTTLVALGL